MNAKTRTFLTLGVTLIPLLLWSLLLFVDRGGDHEGGTVFFLLTLAIISRGVVGMGWLIHLLRNRDVEQTHKLFWAIALFSESWLIFCFGALGIVELVYWFRHVYRPYEVDRMYQAMREE